jgi:hypothetical protein
MVYFRMGDLFGWPRWLIIALGKVRPCVLHRRLVAPQLGTSRAQASHSSWETKQKRWAAAAHGCEVKNSRMDAWWELELSKAWFRVSISLSWSKRGFL